MVYSRNQKVVSTIEGERYRWKEKKGSYNEGPCKSCLKKQGIRNYSMILSQGLNHFCFQKKSEQRIEINTRVKYQLIFKKHVKVIQQDSLFNIDAGETGNLKKKQNES